MSKKWYNFFVSIERARPDAPEQAGVPTPAQTVADIAALMEAEAAPEPALAASDRLDRLYESAGIHPPGHGYSILKVAEMLASEHIRDLPRDVKRGSVMAALEAAGADVQDVIRDAIRRDRALDAAEAARARELAALEASKASANRRLQAELDRLTADYRARMQANADEALRERESFSRWRASKRQEEQKIAEAVSYFVTENPITTCPAEPDGNAARSVAPAPDAAASQNPAQNAG
jgi:hypothetical protein